MQVEGTPRALLRYGAALLCSAIALGVLAALSVPVGFVPLLLLPAVAIVELFGGGRPALLTTAVCTGFSFLFFLNSVPQSSPRIHNLTELLAFPAVAISVIYLMEMRRKQTRAVTERSLELSTLLNSMTEAVFVFDPQGRIVEVNRSAQELARLSREQLIGQHYADMAKGLPIHCEGKRVEVSEFGVARALRGEAVSQERRSFVRPEDGTGVDTIISASPMQIGNNRLLGALLVIRDITELATLQRRIADTERHLAIGQMASGLAHDFNNVLNTITQATALMRINPDQTEEERKRYLIMIDRAARAGAEIIERVREYVRGGTGKPSAVKLPQIIEEALDLAEPMWRTKTRIVVKKRLQDVEPVWANPSDLRRVFTNLIINAIQAMPNGGELIVECEEQDGKIYATVTDSGYGISEEDQKKIFLPYYTTKPTGTGLGLSTAQKIVLAQGGNIRVTSEPGHGTTLTVEIPAMKALQAA